MTPDELEAVARVVIGEVHRTTPLRMAFGLAPWYDDDADEDSRKVYAVIHLADRPPVEDARAPNGTSMDMTQAVFSWDEGFGPGVAFEEMLTQVASCAQDIVQVGLWRRRLDPAWPPCPEHAGRHPLRPVPEPLVDVAPVDRAVPMAANWRCYQPIVLGDAYQDAYGPTALPIGRLAVRNGLATTAD